MPRYAPNKLSSAVKKRYFELLREGLKGAAAARVGVSTSCGSLWFIDAGSMIVPDPGLVSPRFLTQDDRITIADGLHMHQNVKEIAASIGKSFQTVYREIKRGSKPDGRYQPWCGPTTRLYCAGNAPRPTRSATASPCAPSYARSSPRMVTPADIPAPGP
ncbi:helix-turn-helix domain-containing protein [Streptomyces sp. NPDC088253]|uniref:helix-turn-helix domain-containing protein n=1 Tax=Streptomyces sp. NPDC088253 TaxID=3365846 RepID=UPI00382C3919